MKPIAALIAATVVVALAVPVHAQVDCADWNTGAFFEAEAPALLECLPLPKVRFAWNPRNVRNYRKNFIAPGISEKGNRIISIFGQVQVKRPTVIRFSGEGEAGNGNST